MLKAMDEIINNLENLSIYLILVNTILTLVLMIVLVSTKSKLKKLNNRYKKFFKNSDDLNVERLVEENIDLCNEILNKNKDIESKINYIERNMLQCVQKVGIVRYNAFDDVGSNLSFAIALLDGNDNGIVLNGIYSRESTTTYAKSIINGQSKYPLSAEEIQAIDIAKKSKIY
ncbi:DUF4446 family protein [Acetivibrio clariflavus]|uniref:DUF4446 domain-containing protein n=1 Tax=Acetivibrio clariflavus (strain DSM 19732 / NBRC 101661 / EBR45) TaxID=720554 RepID=G8LYQ1_ACECE|nr:DUF4446 family protein [Acetivibrio clariflavus]AEV66769.1 hypothetical protein Clocl_0009 [Acetivibrio clariflavus DSM 19732]